MKLEQGQPGTTASNQLSGQIVARLQGGWLMFARVVWLIVLILAGGLFIASIPSTEANAHIICVTANCLHGSSLTPDRVREMHQLGLSIDSYAISVTIWSILFDFIYIAIGAVIFWRRSDDRMALFSSLTLITFGAAFRGFNPASTLPPLLYALSFIMAFFGNSCLGLFFYLFPTGRFAPRWIGLLALGWMIYWGINNLILGTILTLPGLDFAIFVGLLLSLVATQIYRYRRISTSSERQQTKWVVFGISLALLGVITLFTVENVVPVSIIPALLLGSLLDVFLLLIPLSIGIAILRSHLWDIDSILNRTFVYGGLSVCIIGIYVLVVGYLGALFRTSNSLPVSLLAAGLVAILFQPLRERLQRGANRLFYGQRDEPYAVITRLSQRLEATLAPEAILSAIVETIAQALKLPYAAIALKQDEEFAITASYVSQRGGTSLRDAVIQSPNTFLHLPLLYQSEAVGELVLAPRARGEPLTPADHRLLKEIARQVGIAAHAVRLTADVQHSRERLVTAREEERRRLRRDLHDGLGPALASMTLKLDAARNLLVRDPSAADVLLVNLKKQTQAAVADIRRLAYELRPPSLDELGLISALREQAEQYHIDGLRVTLEAPEPLPSLPAAVEVAAYRIVQEAMTNVVRHAQAHTCTIRFALDHGLDLEICDDGRGIPAGQRAGVGLTSIRERAAELAGRCEIEAMSTGGTRLHIRLPLPRATEREE